MRRHVPLETARAMDAALADLAVAVNAHNLLSDPNGPYAANLDAACKKWLEYRADPTPPHSIEGAQVAS